MDRAHSGAQLSEEWQRPACDARRRKGNEKGRLRLPTPFAAKELRRRADRMPLVFIWAVDLKLQLCIWAPTVTTVKCMRVADFATYDVAAQRYSRDFDLISGQRRACHARYQN